MVPVAVNNNNNNNNREPSCLSASTFAQLVFQYSMPTPVSFAVVSRAAPLKLNLPHKKSERVVWVCSSCSTCSAMRHQWTQLLC